jgi:nucleotide-binding universal stress UspA family protein
MYKKILIANNGSEGACKALAEALRLAHSYESEAHMIYVEENIR